MTKSGVIVELPRFASRERREILERLLELEDEARTLEEHRRLADETFLMMDALEEQNAKDPARWSLGGGTWVWLPRSVLV